MIRFAIWTAVSSQEQAAADKASLKEQEAQCRARAISKGWIETHQPFIVPGESRTRWVNLRDAEDAIPALRDMLDCAQMGEFDVIVLYDYSRLRELLDQVSRTLAAYHVQLYSVNQPVDPQPVEQFDPYMTDSSNAVQFVSKLTSSAEINALRRRYKIGMPRRVSDKGIHPNIIPYGYRKPPGRELDANAVAIIDPPVAAVLIEAKDKFLAGMSLPQVAAWLNTTTIRPKRAKQWSAPSIGFILKNPYYAGIVRFGAWKTTRDPRTGERQVRRNKDASKIVEATGKHEPLWSMQDYRAILKEYQRRWRTFKGHKTHRLSRLLYCGLCGRPLHLTYNMKWKPEATEENRAWYCPANQGVKGEHNKWELVVRDIVILAQLSARLDEDMRNHGDWDELPEKQDKTPDLKKALTDLLGRKDRLTDALEDGSLDPTSYRERVEKLDSKIGELKTDLSTLEAEREGVGARREIIAHFADLVEHSPGYIFIGPEQEVNALLRQLIERVIVTEKGVQIEYVK